jgi:hypothetical protein
VRLAEAIAARDRARQIFGWLEDNPNQQSLAAE